MPATFFAALLLILLCAPLHAFNISGSVRDLDGTGIPSVQISLTGSSSLVTATDALGAYALIGVAPGGTYTLTPSKTGLVFTPLSRGYSLLAADQTSQDFVFGKTWSGGGADALASNSANWSAGAAPTAGDIVRFDATNAAKGCFWDLTTAMESIQLKAAYSSSVVAGVDIIVGSVTIAGGEFLGGAHEIHISKNFQHTGGRFRSSSGGTAFFEGSAIQAVSMVPGSLTAGLYDSYFNGFRVASSSSVRLGSDIVVDGTFNISSGHFEMQSSTLTLTGGTQSGLGGAFNWDDSGGTLVSGSGAVIFDSRAAGTFQIRQDPINAFNNLTAAGSSSLSALSAMNVNGALQVSQIDGAPSLNLGTGFVHTFTGVATVGPIAAPASAALSIGASTAVFRAGLIIGTATVVMQSGQFQIRQSTLQINSQGELQVASGQTGRFVFWNGTRLAVNRGSLRVLGSSVFTSSASASARFSTDLNGSIDIQSPCVFDSLTVAGFRLGASALPVHLDNLFFINGPLGGAAINFNPASVVSVTINSPSFDASISTNVRAVVDPLVAPNPDIDVVLAAGAHASPAYEYDPSNVVRWGLLGIPSGFSGAALGVSSITWSWTIVNHPLGFFVVSSTGAVLSPALTGDTTSWTETALSVNAAYSRAVRAFTDASQADSSPATVYTAAAAPSNVAFASVQVSSLTLTWNINSNPANTLFKIDRSTDDVTYTPLTQGVYASLVPYADTGLIAEKRYYYRIKAANGDGLIAPGIVTVSTVTQPVPPPIVAAVNPSTAPNLGSVTLIVTGAHIQNNALLRLTRAGPVTIAAHDVTVLGEGSIQGTVNLTGVLATAWDVEIENPDGKISLGTGGGLFTVTDAPSGGAVTTGDYDSSRALSLPTTDGQSILSVSAGAFSSSRMYISVDPQNTPLSISPSLIAAATAALKYWILIPGTIREILAFTAQAPYTGGFNSKVSLGISFPDVNHDGIIDSVMLRRATLRMMTLNQTTGAWELIPASTIDIVNNRVNAALNHFSVYALFGSPAAADLSQASVYPSPWKPGSKGVFNADHLTFTALTESGEIRVYNSAAKFMKSISYNATQAGIATWDGQDESGSPLPSGMYLAVIKSSAGDTFTVKFGVER